MEWRASLSGQVRQTYLPKWKSLLPVFEAIMNAYQAIQEADSTDPRIIVNIDREPSLDLGLLERPKITGFTVTDNGVGFHDLNMDSFNTAYSEYKLSRGGKGLGRLIWLKAFAEANIESTFRDDLSGEYVHRSIAFHESYSPDAVEVKTSARSATGTQLSLSGFRDPWKSESPVELEQIARRICEHFVLILMRQDCPAIELRDGKNSLSVNRIFEATFKAQSTVHPFEIRGEKFEVIGFRLDEPRSSRHRIIYCADDRAVVTEPLDKYIPNLKGRLRDEEGNSFVYLAVVTGAYLNARVNPVRTDFLDDEPEPGPEPEPEDGLVGPTQIGLFKDDIRRADIREECVRFVQTDLSSILDDINAAKLKTIEAYVQSDAPHYRFLLRRSDEFIDRMPVDGSRPEIEAALHRELHMREVELKKQGTKVLLEAAKLTEYDDYKDRLTDFLTSNNELGIAALAQYVMHRKIILELFRKAITADQNDNKYPLEKVLHHIIFPMRTNVDDILLSQQNLWILDERLNYHSFVGSDQRLDKIGTLGSESALRPDLIIFDRQFPLSDGPQPISSLTIVEFKRPMRDDYTDDDNPLKQVVKTVQAVRASEYIGQNSRPVKVASKEIPTNCFIVCDITPKLREQLTDWGRPLLRTGRDTSDTTPITRCIMR
jgi:hypothetical protein